VSTNALAIREAIFVRMQTLPGYAKYRRVLTPQIHPTDLPCLSVSIVSEVMSPDGDENAGEPRFISDTVIGISVVRGFADPVALDGQVDIDVDTIEQKLLTDPTFVRFGPSALFEGVTQITRRRLYPFEGETYFLELRLEMSFRSRVDFEPQITSPFAGVLMNTVPVGGTESTLPIQSVFPVSE
jgi:hypothetical protein